MLKSIDYDEPLISQILILIETIFGIKLKNIEGKQKDDDEDIEMEEESKEENSEDEKVDLNFDLDYIYKQTNKNKVFTIKGYLAGQSGFFDLYFYDNLINFFNFLSLNKFSEIGQYEERDFSKFQNLIEKI